MNFTDFFRNKTTEKSNTLSGIESKAFLPIRSRDDGAFTLFFGEEAIKLLGQVGIGRQDIEALLTPVYEKCKALQFAHGEPVHFMLDVKHIKNEKTCMAVAKVQPPMPVNGVLVTRSILIFVPEFMEIMNEIELNVRLAIAQLQGKIKPSHEKAFIESIPDAKKTKALMMISHELVHIFATDEYKSLMPLLGLDLLELLTDSINFDIHGENYKIKSAIEMGAFVEGFAYLVNFIKAKQGLDQDKCLTQLRTCSNEIIRKCNKMKELSII